MPTTKATTIDDGDSTGRTGFSAEGTGLSAPASLGALAKEVVDKGGVRLTTRVETREQLVDELLKSDHVEVERRLFNTAIADDAIPGVRQEGDTLVVPVIEEVLITVKRLVLVEEVRITRTQQTHRKPQSVTLRKEHIEVERLAAEKPSPVKSS